ncbi:hypothetical protein D3C71_2070980 [compost metagenome]
MLPLTEGSASMASRLTLVPAPILVALNTSEPPSATAVTVSRVVRSPVRAALMVLILFRSRKTLSSVFVPSPDLVMLTV